MTNFLEVVHTLPEILHKIQYVWNLSVFGDVNTGSPNWNLWVKFLKPTWIFLPNNFLQSCNLLASILCLIYCQPWNQGIVAVLYLFFSLAKRFWLIKLFHSIQPKKGSVSIIQKMFLNRHGTTIYPQRSNNPAVHKKRI